MKKVFIAFSVLLLCGLMTSEAFAWRGRVFSRRFRRPFIIQQQPFGFAQPQQFGFQQPFGFVPQCGGFQQPFGFAQPQQFGFQQPFGFGGPRFFGGGPRFGFGFSF